MKVNYKTGEINTPPTKKYETLVPPFFKTPHNHNTDQESDRTGLMCLDRSLTQQHSKEETDINTIVDRFLKTGELPPVRMPPTYADFDEVFDFQTAMNAVNQARQSFLALPANIRTRFNNDPEKFVRYVDYCLENGDIGPLREMGLAVKEPAPDPKNAKTGQQPETPPKSPPGGQSDPG